MADKMIDGKTASEWFKLGYKAEDSLRKLEYYGYTTELDPKNGNAWNNRGTALVALKRYEEAIQSYDKAIELDPKKGNAWNNRGVALRQLKR